MQSTLAQDYERIQPKVPPPSETNVAIPESPLPPAGGATDTLVDELKGIVFVEAENEVSTPAPDVVGVVTNNIGVISHPDFNKVLDPYLGKPLSLSQLNQMVREVILYCRSKDRPVVDVVVPRQDITSGVVQLVVLVGRVGQVRVEGNHWISSSELQKEIRLKPGSEISSQVLTSDVEWINQNPFRDAAIIFTPGEDPGQTDVILKVKDRFPARFYIGYENTGNVITGKDRYIGGFNWGDAFFTGQQLNYQYTTSGDGQSLSAHSGSYVIPLPWRHTLTFFGALSSSEAVSDVSIRGSGSQVGTRYDIPLPEVRGVYTQDIQLGYDWKQSDNSLEFGSIPLTAVTTDVSEFSLGYHSELKDPYGSTTFNPQVYYSPGEMMDHQTDADYNTSRPGATPDFAYMRFELTRTTNLPYRFSLYHDFMYQWTDAPLLPSEELGFGGAYSIRGYNEWDISDTDKGWILRNELRFPAVSFGHLLGLQPVQDQFQFLVFFDYGEAQGYHGDITLNNGEAKRTVPMAGVGPGVRYNVNSYLSARADYGYQLYDTGDPHPVHLSLSFVLSY